MRNLESEKRNLERKLQGISYERIDADSSYTVDNELREMKAKCCRLETQLADKEVELARLRAEHAK